MIPVSNTYVVQIIHPFQSMIIRHINPLSPGRCGQTLKCVILGIDILTIFHDNAPGSVNARGIMEFWANIDLGNEFPDSKVHGANMGPPGSCRPHVGPMNLAIRVACCEAVSHILSLCLQSFMMLHAITRGPFYLHGLAEIPAWIANHMPSNVWDEITYSFSNFSVPVSYTSEFWNLGI